MPFVKKNIIGTKKNQIKPVKKNIHVKVNTKAEIKKGKKNTLKVDGGNGKPAKKSLPYDKASNQFKVVKAKLPSKPKGPSKALIAKKPPANIKNSNNGDDNKENKTLPTKKATKVKMTKPIKPVTPSKPLVAKPIVDNSNTATTKTSTKPKAPTKSKAVIIKVTEADIKAVTDKETISAPMGDYHSRNTTYENTLSKLAKERDSYVVQGEKVATRVDKLVLDAEAYAKKLTAATKKAILTSQRGKKMSALWKRIVYGVDKKASNQLNAKGSDVNAKDMHDKKSINSAKVKFEEKNRVENLLKNKTKDDIKALTNLTESDDNDDSSDKNANDELKKMDKEAGKAKKADKKNIKNNNEDESSDKDIKAEIEKMNKKFKKKMNKLSNSPKKVNRRLEKKATTTYINSSIGLDLNEPVAKLISSLKANREALSKTVINIQEAHDNAKENDTKAGTLVDDEKNSQKIAVSAQKVLTAEMTKTKKIRSDKKENFPALPKEVEKIK